MLTVAPMGRTKREMRGSTPHLSFMQRKVIGSVAALWKEGGLGCGPHRQGAVVMEENRERGRIETQPCDRQPPPPRHSSPRLPPRRDRPPVITEQRGQHRHLHQEE
ncbi:hypothetical protein E2C01_081875 [Portunus trituberculatus]|uniref:Uncharacterized protein n=1 Tax=Portunus trituberculatus TaxID=210409 RepID=A0A5B7J015_PORTR|nr:hypothetical protein [Portunus trituberculatus]